MKEPFDAAYRERFDEVYRGNLWNGTDTRSTGPGGGAEAKALVAPILMELVAKLGISSVLDVGCGEGLWMPDLPGYVGVDVSVEALSVAKAAHPGRDYRLYEGGPLPEAELVVCKHVLQHIDIDAGVVLLDRIRATGASWLVATSFTKGQNSHDKIKRAGGYWPDLSAEPFALGRPSYVWGPSSRRWEKDEEHGGVLALWSLKEQG